MEASPTLSPDDQAELARRRDEFWRQVGATALGVFIGLTLWSAAMWAVASALIEDAFDDEPAISLEE